MNILFLTSRFPYPPYRGDKLKIFNLIRTLSKNHSVTLLSFIEKKEELQYIDSLKPFCRNIEVVYLPFWRSVWSCWTAIFSKVPFQVAYYSAKQMHKLLLQELDSDKYDVLHCHLIRMAQYRLDQDLSVPTLLDLTDAGSLYLERFLTTTTNILKKVLLQVELSRLRTYEKNLQHFDVNLVCSAVDKMILQKNAPTARIELLFNGVDLEYFSSNGTIHPNPYQIIYTGNMSYFPNVDGAQYFIRNIFPIIKREIPEATLYIVGQDPLQKIRKLASSDIVVTGFVPDIKEYYLRSTVAVAPIRFGAGTLNKVLEPMALGIPTVTTSIGAEGLPIRSEEHALIADEPDEFAQCVIRLLQDDKLRKQLSANSKVLVRSLYDWTVIGETLENIYKSIAPYSKKYR